VQRAHIKLKKSGAGFEIFSKSGIDLTNDRMGIHRALRDSLELDTAGCQIKKRCILEGELLVWNDDNGWDVDVFLSIASASFLLLRST
jgi:DNA ligase-4